MKLTNGLPFSVRQAGFIQVGNAIYAAISGHGLYESDDVGENWYRVDRFEQDSTTVLGNLVFDDGYIFASTSPGVISRTRDDQTDLTPHNSGILGTNLYQLRRLTTASGSALYAATDNGLWASTDGMNWTSAGLLNRRVTDLARSDSNLFASVMNVGILRSSISGNKWVQLPEWDSLQDASSILSTPKALLVSGSGSRIHRSVDHGSTWTTIETRAGLTPSFYYDSISGRTFAFSTSLSISGDQGATWLPSTLTNVKSIVRFGTSLYATTEGALVESTDNGDTWGSNEMIASYPRLVSAYGSNLFLTSLGPNPTSSAVLLSTDGHIWKSLSIPAYVWQLSSVYADSANVYVGTLGFSVWRAALNSSLSVRTHPSPNNIRIEYTDETITVTAPGATIGSTASLYDINGRLVYDSKFGATETLILRRSELPSLSHGTYLLKVFSNGEYTSAMLRL